MVGVLDDFDGCIEENGANRANGGCGELAAEQEGTGQNGEEAGERGKDGAERGKDGAEREGESGEWGKFLSGENYYII